MTNQNQPETWKSLSDIRKELPKGVWRHTGVYEEMAVATEFKRTLEELWLLPTLEKHFLIAYYRTRSTMLAYDAHLRELAAKKPRKRKR